MSLPIRRVVSCLLIFFLFTLPASAATFTVDDTGDGADANPGNGICATSGGVCTLRAAIQEANSLSGSDTIEFDIAGSGPHTIQPGSALPATTQPITIDGTTEPDYNSSPVIEIDGTNAGSGADGLLLQNSAGVLGLAIINFNGDGIEVNNASSCSIEGSYIGVSAEGNAAGNVGTGIYITNGSTFNLISNNTISNNSSYGVFIGLSGSDNNTVTGNRIGTDPSGSSAMGNAYQGVLANSVTGTQIGGDILSQRNIIADNGRGGIEIVGGEATVEGNYVGTNTAGDAALPNSGPGIELLSGASNVTVGGTSGDAGNVVSGNTEHGVLITGSSTSGIVQGNYIGTNAAGNAALSNGTNGIEIADGASATVGGTASGESNIVAGNAQYEVLVATSGNTIQGNYLDTNANGDDLGSSSNALRLTGDNNQVGGTTASASNVIGHTATSAVSINGTGNTLQGNYIGVMPDGTAIGHASTGIRVYGTGHTIGGIGAGEANTIANAGWGIGVGAGSGHTIRGNSIYNQAQQGIDFDRDGVTPNDAGDSDTGANRLQNFPEIQSADYDGGANEITVAYAVPSDPSLTGSGSPVYDLTVDFYRADANGSGKAYLGTDTYTATDYNGGPSKQITFTPAASVTSADDIVATATDANGNTSEFSASPATLPVELAAFGARVDGESVELTWRTASETNNAGFEVQRKADGASFRTITFVDGAGTTSRPQRYRFTDADLPFEAERITYRLKQVDVDGAFEYSDEVEVVLNVPDQLTLEANAPNPVHQQTTIRYALPTTTEVQLAVFDVLGRRVATLVSDRQPAGRHEVTFDAADLPSGVYLYRLQAGDTVQSKRLTIVR